MPPDHARSALSAVALTGGVLLAALMAIYFIRHATRLEDFITRVGIIGPLVSIGLQTFFGASPVPTEPLTMINGAVFGPFKGAVISWIGYMLASVIEYFLGARIGHISRFEERRKQLPFGLGRLPADSPWFLILARVIPGFGPKVVGVVSGVYRVSFWRFLWTAAIPNFVGAFLFALGGSGLKSLL